MDGEAREIQLDGVKRQRLFRSNMKTESTDLREREGKRKKERLERWLTDRLQELVRFLVSA